MLKIITEEGIKKLNSEREFILARLDELKEVVTDAMKTKDTEENTEFIIATNDMARFELRLHTINDVLLNAKVIQNDIEAGKASLGNTVKVKFCDTDDIDEFVLCSSFESNPLEGKLSIESPIGMCLYKRKVGDRIEIDSPDGKYCVEIVDIF